MSTHRLLASVALAAALGAMPAMAQEKKDAGPAPGGTPGQGPAAQPQRTAPAPGARGPAHAPGGEVNRGPAKPEGAQSHVQRQQEPNKTPTRGASETQKGATPKGNAENNTHPAPDRGKAASQTPAQQPGNKAADSKGKEPSRNATTERKDAQQGKSASDQRGEHNRVQLSEQQRTNVHRDVLKERNVNRTSVKVNVRVGGHVPRSIRLAVLPAAVLTIVPAYRAYRYFVVDDEICIVDPNTYEVVEVIRPGSSIAQGRPNTNVGLSLSEQERMIVLGAVNLTSSGSTLGLGAMSEGAAVPRNIMLASMPVTVVDRIPRLQGYKYFVAEQRVAIVDPDGHMVQLVIDAHEK